MRSNHKSVWQKLNPVGGALPPALANRSAWEAFHQGLCAPPTVNLQPPSVQHPCTIPSSAALDADITEREVELALPKLSNGKAVGGAGWPAELLRYAAHYVTMEDGTRHKVWVLAPLLTRFLNRCFRAGVLPPCISSVLVTPIHKKGCTLDAANYRLIAVGEPLYRLYTIILNKRLVGWSEEHQLRSPVQAGFRPGQSPIHHLFALRHFIDQLASRGALRMPALWTSRRPMILSTIIFCGTNWSPLGWALACWRPLGLCIPVALSR